VIVLSRIDKCKELVQKFFGPSVVTLIDKMVSDGKSEDDIIADCRKKTAAFLGEEKAAEFDSI